MKHAQADAFCVDFTPSKDRAQVLKVDTEQFRLLDKLSRTINGANEFKFAQAGGGSVSIESTSTSEFKHSVEDQSYAVVARVRNAPATAQANPDTPLRLKEKYQAMLATEGGPAQFRKECGDSFVLRLIGGAQLVALGTVHELTEERRSGVKVTFKAGVVGFDVTGTTEDQQTRERLTKTTKFSYSLIGGAGAKGAADVATLGPLIESLTALARDDPGYWQMDLRSYETVLGWPPHLTQSIPENRMQLATAMYARIRQIELGAATALARPDDYIRASFFPTDIEKTVEDTRAALKELSTRMQACSQDAGRCKALPEKDQFDYYWYYTRLPVRRGTNEFDKRKVDLETKLAVTHKAQTEALAKYSPKVDPQHRPVTCEALRATNSTPRVVRVASYAFELMPEYRDAIAACVANRAAVRALLSVGGPIEEALALKETVTQRWLRSLDLEACGLDKDVPGHPMCLPPAERREWEELIQARSYGRCRTFALRWRCAFAAEDAPQLGRDRSPRTKVSMLFPS